jgi:ATP/ADP translocase
MKLYETLNIRRDEVLPVSLFIFQSVFLGVFLGAFDVGANTLFLKAFDSSMISKAFAVSGLIGIILTSLYTFFQARITFSRLSLINLMVVFLISFLLRFGYYFSDSKWLAFGLFVMMGPLNIVALVGFWGTVSRIFDLRQGKRIFGIIDTGQVVGVILSSWAVPFLVANGFQTNNLLYISAAAIFVSFGFQVYITSAFPGQLKAKVVKETKRTSFTDTMKIPYVRTMAYFVVLSMLVAFFVHYMFLAVAKTRFESSEELAKFLGGLMGTLTFVSILIKSFVYGTLMNNYGLKVTLLVSPIIMAFLTVVAAIVGSFFGYTLESATFTFFFLIISLSKLFQKALKDSVESPSLKMLYQSLDPSIRYEVQSRVDGTVNEIAALFSGILLTLFSLISFFVMIHYTYILFLIIALWGFVTVYLYKGYRNTLQLTLKKSVKNASEPETAAVLSPSLSAEGLAEKLSLVEKSKPWNLQEIVREGLSNPDVNNLHVLLEKIKESGFTVFKDQLEKLKPAIKDKQLVDSINQTLAYLGKLKSDSADTNLIKNLIASKNFEDRIYAAKVLGTASDPDIKNNLTFLMRDLVPSVKKQAIRASEGTKSKEIMSFLIDFLDKDQYAALAHASLLGSGDTGLEMLDQALQKTNLSDIFLERVYRIIPETGGANAKAVLYNKFSVKSSHGRTILDGLLKLDYTADNKAKLALNQKIIEQAGICAWNLNAFHFCPHDSEIPFLKEELDKEFHKSIHYLFGILKLAYDKNSINAVLENLEAGTGQSISFAVELLDTFIDEDIKPYIVPLLEDTSIANKIWSLENYFPLRHFTTDTLIKAIINRDNNLIGKQAKIFALNAFRHIENHDVSADLVSQLFNTDKILRLISAQIIEGIDKHQFLDCKRRLNDKLRVELEKQISLFQSTGLSATDRINFFKTLFNGDSEERDILFLLYQTAAIKVNKSNLFNLELFKEKAYLIFIETGGAVLYKGEEQIMSLKVGQVLNTSDKNKLPWSLMTEDNTIIHYIEYDKVANCLYDQDYLVKYIEQ